MVAKNSASVLLIRPATGAGVEVFVQVRAASMAFAPGVVAFPGGSVDPADAAHTHAWTLPAQLQASLTEDAAEASGLEAEVRGHPVSPQELVAAAVRETFEECGVLLASPPGEPGAPLPQLVGAESERDRLVRHEIGVGQALADLGVEPHLDGLVCVDRWITPTTRPRRYDTRFFAAALPEGQSADGRNTEAVDSFWIRPSDALEEFRNGSLAVMAPTWAQLDRLARASNVVEALHPSTTGVTMPHLRKDAAPGEPTVSFWGEEAYLAAGKPIFG